MTKCHKVSQSVTKCHKVTVGALKKLSGWVGGGGTVIITSAPGPGFCHSQRFFEIGLDWT